MRSIISLTVSKELILRHVVFRVPISDQAIVIVALRLPSMDGMECDSKDAAPHIGLLLSEMPVQGLGKQRTLAFSGAPLHPLKAKADKIHETWLHRLLEY